MNYLEEMNETDTGYEVLYKDDEGAIHTSSFDSYEKALLFINTLQI
jgi:hypothetical protein